MPLSIFLPLRKIDRRVFAPFFLPSAVVPDCEGLKQYKQRKCGCHFAVGQQTIVDDLIGLEMEDQMYCGQFGKQFNPNQIKHAAWYIMNF